MMKFHAVMMGEDRMEFGVEVEAKSRSAAYDELEELYPESRVIQLSDEQQMREREERLYARLNYDLDNDW